MSYRNGLKKTKINHKTMTISIIIPTLNEAENVGRLIAHLRLYATEDLTEIIVVDAKSTDNTEGVARNAGARVITSEIRCRAVQMNAGASQAIGDVLYFVHADCFPPPSYCTDIQAFIHKGYAMGCFRYRFDSPKIMLKINAFFTRFNALWCRGGDETLYVKRAVFEELNQFDEYFCIMEEYDFIIRAKAKYNIAIMPKYVMVSARKYDTNSWWRVQKANLTVFRMFKKGIEPNILAKTYKEMLSYRY
jgi:rSAM/selenodomain-associated transferase 2